MKQSLSIITLFSASILASTSIQAAPGSLSQIPLFVSAPTQPNIFFMLDDSGSMDWTMPVDGLSSSSLVNRGEYDTIPDNNKEWLTWCSGANLLAYDANTTYKPWAANIPGTSTPFPDASNISDVRVDPLKQSGGSINYTGGENNIVRNSDDGTVNLSAAPVVTWTDSNSNGQYDAGECPIQASDSGWVRADSLSKNQQINFANWFSYYRSREHTTKSAVTQVISTSSARMGMATLHHNNNVGSRIKDMTISANKDALLKDIVNMNSSGGTPLRTRLDYVGQYFSTEHTTPNALNIGSAPSPILTEAEGGACQQNFVMLMTDGQWNGSSPNVGHQDKTENIPYIYKAHKDTTQDLLADVAMKWYKTDLAPALPAKVTVQNGNNTQNLDQNNDQHLVTFGVAFGATGTLTADPVDRTATFTWPVPSSNSVKTVDDLRHAAYNGRGKFLSAKKPQELVKSLQDVISDIEARQGSAASVAFNMSALSTDTVLYFAGFDTVDWTGDVVAYNIDPNNGDILSTSPWTGTAASRLNSRTDADMISNRVAYTWGVDSLGGEDGVLFNWSTSAPNPAAVTLADLSINSDESVEVSPFTESKQRVNFLRGDTSKDGIGLTRKRASRLGDIIHSSPLYVATPSSNWPDDTTFFGAASHLYSTYQSNLQQNPREAMLYVGANDGFLHGFSALNGSEVLAYVPSAVTSALSNSGLHHLTESDYSHRYYVDGEVISADVYIKPEKTSASKSWRTILAGSLRGGGQGIFALDVTDPNNYNNTTASAASNVLWEFTNQVDPDLGYTFSSPQIAMMNNGKWAVIVGNGYNDSGSHTAQLMIIFIEEGVDGVWSPGDYMKINTSVGNSVTPNGLSTPTLIDLDHNGTIDRVYAGDLLGNMWAFDTSTVTTTPVVGVDWKVAYSDVSGPLPLFSAGTNKPITMKPLLVKPEATWLSDNVSSSPNMMVYFGTGQYIATGDASNIDQQTFYGIWDSGTTVKASSLVEQTYLPTTKVDTRLLSQNPVTYDAVTPSNDSMGWFIDLYDPGERVTVEAFELEGLVFFNTTTPSSEPCSAGGSSFLMAVDKKTGGTPTIVTFDTDGNGKLEAGGDSFYAGMKFEHGIASKTTVLKTNTGINYGYTSGTDSSSTGQGNGPPVQKSILPGSTPPAVGSRQSWIQLIND